MKLIHADFKKGVKIAVETKEDLWYLNSIIEKGDQISGKTERKIKVGNLENAKAAKKTFFLHIEVEKVEFHKYSDILRASGKVISENDDVPKGSYHTFDIEQDSVFTLYKDEWMRYQKDKLFEASKENFQNIMILVLDRSDATFAMLKKYGHEKILELEGDVAKKALDEKKENSFYKELIKKLEEYDERFKLNKIIIASPAFWKEDLVKEIKNDSLKKKIITATCSSSKNALEEVLKRPELASVLKEEKAAQESKLVEDLFSEIAKDGKAVYGLKEVKNSCDAGAISVLLITDHLIHKKKEAGQYGEIDYLMKDADKKDADIKIISSENDAGKRLDGLGGIAAMLRYKMNY